MSLAEVTGHVQDPNLRVSERRRECGLARDSIDLRSPIKQQSLAINAGPVTPLSRALRGQQVFEKSRQSVIESLQFSWRPSRSLAPRKDEAISYLTEYH